MFVRELHTYGAALHEFPGIATFFRIPTVSRVGTVEPPPGGGGVRGFRITCAAPLRAESTFSIELVVFPW